MGELFLKMFVFLFELYIFKAQLFVPVTLLFIILFVRVHVLDLSFQIALAFGSVEIGARFVDCAIL